ncbi:DUF3152 domain-containing protein [Streptomyces sp. NPDC001675]
MSANRTLPARDGQRSRPGRSERRSGPAHAGTRRWKSRPLAALAVLTVVSCGAVGWAMHSGADEIRAGASTIPTNDAPLTPSPSRTGHTSSTSNDSGQSADSPARPVIPATGPGTFTAAKGEGASVGTGTPLRYLVEVEDGLDVSAADAARQVERILADRRGWTANGRSAFQRVSSGPTDFVVRIATPGTVDKICGQYGLDTGGEVNCNVAKNVMVNLRRWLLATPTYAHDVTAYRALIINHEVGHFLGHGHVGCPGPGQPAPTMMQQIKGMDGCVPNVWPYDERGRYVTGPAIP